MNPTSSLLAASLPRSLVEDKLCKAMRARYRRNERDQADFVDNRVRDRCEGGPQGIRAVEANDISRHWKVGDLPLATDHDFIKRRPSRTDEEYALGLVPFLYYIGMCRIMTAYEGELSKKFPISRCQRDIGKDWHVAMFISRCVHQRFPEWSP